MSNERVIEHRACYLETPKYSNGPRNYFDESEVEQVLREWGLQPLPLGRIYEMLTVFMGDLQRDRYMGRSCPDCGFPSEHTKSCTAYAAHREAISAQMNQKK